MSACYTSLAGPKTHTCPVPQIEVLELQNAVFCNCTRYLSSALATCTRLHTLVATGLWPLDLSVISQAPNLQCLAINICRGTSLSPLAKLPQLRCGLLGPGRLYVCAAAASMLFRALTFQLCGPSALLSLLLCLMM